MRVLVRDPAVMVQVGVRLAAVPVEFVRVPVVHVMHVAVAVFDRFVRMLVGMVLAEMQPYAPAHQDSGEPERGAGGFSRQGQRRGCADERSPRGTKAGH
jgi:hypothetical protein